MGGYTASKAQLDTHEKANVEITFDTPLADYVSPEEHEAHAKTARIVADYHEFKARAVRARLVGNIALAQGFEEKCERLASAFRTLT